MDKQNTIIIVVGPTAVGKTAFSIELAKLLNTDIISADSRQCYKELNIGVAKPSDEELQAVKHYFINSHSIQEEVNAAIYEQYALQAAADIFQHKKVAVMVGGTGLYIKAFCEGLDDIPEVDEATRKIINEQFGQKGLTWLQNEVRQKDPVFWEAAEQQNPQRLMRALEVVESTGISITAYRKGNKEQRPFNIIKIGLELPRERLYERINNRVDKMMDDGLLEEVKGLRGCQHLYALQTVGYKEVFEYLNGSLTLDEGISEIKKNTRHYAKRQLTWFRKDATINWYNAASPAQEILQQLNPRLDHF